MSPGSNKSQQAEWARLIPGEQQVPHRGGKKPPQSIRAFVSPNGETAFDRAERSSERALSLLLPAPLSSRQGWQWAQAIVIDFVLVAVNWLAIGALLVPLHLLFPDRYLFQFAAGAPRSLLGIALLHATLITLLGYSERLHAPDTGRSAQRPILLKSILMATAILSGAYVLQGARWTTTILFLAAALLHGCTLSLWRVQASFRRVNPRNVLIVGSAAAARRIASYIEKNVAAGRKVCGFLDNDRGSRDGVIGKLADLAHIARKEFVDEVILVEPTDPRLTQCLVREAQRLHLDVEIVPELFGCNPEGEEIEWINGAPLIGIHAEPLPVVTLITKRLVDIALASLALFVLSPFLLLIAAAVKLDSSGPVLYNAKRVGRKGQLFPCHKFRTMVRNADELKNALRRKNERSGPFFKITGDPRITRVGRVLRRYSLDELPQLFNVLKGQMSLVGPRPHPLDDVAGYDIEDLARLDVTPGITGLWQVTARRDPSFQRGIELDRDYIRRWSLGLDFRILLKTFVAVLEGSGE